MTNKFAKKYIRARTTTLDLDIKAGDTVSIFSQRLTRNYEGKTKF